MNVICNFWIVFAPCAKVCCQHRAKSQQSPQVPWQNLQRTGTTAIVMVFERVVPGAWRHLMQQTHAMKFVELIPPWRNVELAKQLQTLYTEVQASSNFQTTRTGKQKLPWWDNWWDIWCDLGTVKISSVSMRGTAAALPHSCEGPFRVRWQWTCRFSGCSRHHTLQFSHRRMPGQLVGLIEWSEKIVADSMQAANQ